MIEIRKPLFNLNKDNQHYVGLACYKVDLEPSIVDVVISYQNQKGRRLYPNPFKISKSEIKKYPKRTYNNMPMYVVPVSAMSEGHTH